jgi:hypothetical protein
MEDNAMPKRMLKGRPRMRWLEDAENDLKKMKVTGWKEKMRETGCQGGQGSPRAVAPSEEEEESTYDFVRILYLGRVNFSTYCSFSTAGNDSSCALIFLSSSSDLCNVDV